MVDLGIIVLVASFPRMLGWWCAENDRHRVESHSDEEQLHFREGQEDHHRRFRQDGLFDHQDQQDRSTCLAFPETP